MKGTTTAALLRRSTQRVVTTASSSSSMLGPPCLRGVGANSVMMAKSRWSKGMIVGTSVASRSAAISSLASTAQSQQIIVRAAAVGTSSKNRSLVDRHPQQQQLHLHQQQWRHMVMITKTTKAGDVNNKADTDDDDVIVNMANEILDMTSNITPSKPPFQPDEETHQLLNITDACWNKIEQLAAAKRKQKIQTEEGRQGESSSSSSSLKDNNNNNNIYLRVFVDAGGCSGFSYRFEFDTDENMAQEDLVFTRKQQQRSNDDNDNPKDNVAVANVADATARVVVDAGSLEYIQGCTIDYVQEMIKSSFQVRDNPQSESACGCGSSFAVKNFSSNPALD